MKTSRLMIGAAFGLLALASALPWFGPAKGQPINVPQVQSIGPSDLFQDIANGQPSAQSVYANSALLGNYSATLGGNNPENAIIGGDATTNLWARGTTGSSVTTTLTYGGPDRFAYWSGTSTAMTVSRSNTAGEQPAQFAYGFKMARTSGQTGVVQMCMMQVLESVNSYGFAGQTAEIDFHAFTGANFSAASQNMTVYLISGTGVDGSAATAAFNLNAGGGGSSLWTGQVNTGVVVSLQGIGIQARYTVAVPVPAAAAQVAVALCYTPVGTAGTNDYITISGIQLTRNSALTTVAGTAGAALNPNDLRAKSFARRTQALETLLQQRYYVAIAESVTSGAQQTSSGNGASTTTCSLYVPFPVTMRAAPTFGAIGTALSASTWTITHVVTATALSTPFLAVLGANTVNGGSLTATVASGLTTGQTCVLTSANGGSILGFTAEL